MDRRLYLLCEEYTKIFELVYTLIKLDLSNHERLTLFRLSQERLTLLENEMFDYFIEKDYDQLNKKQ